MSADLLTIDNMFAGLSNTLSTQQRQDAGARDKPISPLADDRPTAVNSSRIEATDNVATDTGQAVSERPAREFREVLREKTKSDGPVKGQDGTESKEQSEASGPAKPSDVVPTWLAENAVPVLQSREGIAVKMEPKAGRELAQLIASLKTEKSPPATGHAAKSGEIRLILLAGEKGQLGLKTVLPEKSSGLNGLKTVLPDAPGIIPVRKAQPEAGEKNDKIVPRNEAAVGARAFNNKGDIKDLMPEISAGVGGKADAPEKKAANTGVSVTPAAAKTLAPDTKKDLIRENVVDEANKKTTADGKNASVKTDLPAIQAHLVEKHAQSPGSSPGKRAPSTEANAGTNAQQAPSKSSGRNGNESEHAGNKPPNGSAFRKLSVSEVQVSADQPKDQGRSAGAKNPSANFEQLLSHNPQQIPTTQQSAVPMANAKPANLPGQTLPNDGAADVGKQILESIHSSLAQPRGDQQITVRLNPPELGKVFIKLQERDAELTGILEVSRTQTRAEIEQALPQIIRNLADCGVQVKRFDVVLSEQGRSGQEAFGGQSPQNNGPYEHDSTNQEAWSDETNFREVGEWSPNNAGYQNVSELQEAFVSDGSINMLI